MQAARPALGIDLGGTKIEAVLLAPDGAERWRQRVATPAGDYGATVAALAALVAHARALGSGPFSIGIATPGALALSGLMKNCNSTCLNGQPLRADLQAAFGQPVALANDANCLALSEATDGAGAGAGVVFAAILGTGVGAGIAVNGQVLQGPHRLAGEWGHNPLPWAEPGRDPSFDCYCGQRGCIETLVSGSGLARDHAHVNGEALAGDAACRATLERHAERLWKALAAVINLLDPDVIVFAGGLSALPGLVEGLPVAVAPWVFSAGSDAPLSTRFVRAAHGDASGVRGAAWLWR